jgi:hypothetical protein
MKSKIVLSIVLIIISTTLLYSCKKKVLGCMDPNSTNYNPSATKDDGSCSYNGTVSFWSVSGASATVSINGIDKYSKYVQWTTNRPVCGSSDLATFNLPTGIYYYNARSNGFKWNGSITILKNDCLLIGLY